MDGLDRYLQNSLTLMFQSHTSVAIFIGIHRVHTVIILCMSAIYSNTCCMQFTKWTILFFVFYNICYILYYVLYTTLYTICNILHRPCYHILYTKSNIYTLNGCDLLHFNWQVSSSPARLGGFPPLLGDGYTSWVPHDVESGPWLHRWYRGFLVNEEHSATVMTMI